MNVQDCKVGDVLVLEKDHHIRFVEWRNDKDETDSLEKAFKLRDMAKNLK